MITIQSRFDTAKALFCGSKMEARFEMLYQDMQTYIEVSGYQEKVFVNSMVLAYVITDYMADIQRLKEFHKVNHINSIKVTSYTLYWLLRRKPIQVLADDKELIYVNERFALAHLAEFLSDKDKGLIISRDDKALGAFLESVLYFFKYRLFSAQDIEMMIISFFAGQVYQETSEDISHKLPPSDYENLDQWK